jgi:hypothetical protein
MNERTNDNLQTSCLLILAKRHAEPGGRAANTHARELLALPARAAFCARRADKAKEIVSSDLVTEIRNVYVVVNQRAGATPSISRLFSIYYITR